jgi:glycosyltransferase involved in cell wall biosynthesis
MNGRPLPRVLVVTSNNFNTVTGGGITLTNLFRGWASGRIANVHEDPTPPDYTACQNFYRLSTDEIPWVWPFALCQPKGGTGALANGVPQGKRGAASLSRILLGDGIPRRVHLTDRFRSWIDQFRPELIYSFLGSMAQIRMTRELVHYTHAALAIHVMDDWPEVVYRRGLFGPLLRQVVLKEFQQLLRISSARFGICEEMCKEYQRRYGYTFLPFHNALDIGQWIEGGRKAWAAGRPFIVCYAGSILREGQRESLRDVCIAVENMARAGVSIQMHVYSPSGQTEYLKNGAFSSLMLTEPPAADAIIPVLSGADVLVLPFNFDSASARYLRYSMPTKIPAYMASGSPVLVYGPSEIASVAYAESEGWAFVLTRRGAIEVEKALRTLMDDAALREHLGRRGQELARRRHDAAQVRAEFQSALARCVV